MRVLIYIHGRIQRKNMRTAEQQANRAKRNNCPHGLYLSFGQPHWAILISESILTLVPETLLVSIRNSFQTAATMGCYFSVAGQLTIAE
jgi:hypothetical protein